MIQLDELNLRNLSLLLLFVAASYVIKFALFNWAPKKKDINPFLYFFALKALLHGAMFAFGFTLIFAIAHVFLLNKIMKEELYSTLVSFFIIVVGGLLVSIMFRLEYGKNPPKYFAEALFVGRARSLVIVYVITCTLSFGVMLHLFNIQRFNFTNDYPSLYLAVILFHSLIFGVWRDFDKHSSTTAKIGVKIEDATEENIESIFISSKNRTIIEFETGKQPLMLSSQEIPPPYLWLRLNLKDDKALITARFRSTRKNTKKLAKVQMEQLARISNKHIKALQKELYREGIPLKLPIIRLDTVETDFIQTKNTSEDS